ncbi:hypothetical protein C4578_00170 [Candidatus Microgenomates bacterium]|jgi:hypothetical protein|nr:MAG: hypothetical protein C4578_00170 [Candidatus Microgenomates bacterium]
MKTELAQVDFEVIQNYIPGLKSEFGIDNNEPAAQIVFNLIDRILPVVFIIAGLLLFFYLIAAGFQMMTSPGDEKAAASAKAKITNALAGFLILFVSFWLVKLLGYILGLDLI